MLFSQEHHIFNIQTLTVEQQELVFVYKNDKKFIQVRC